MCRSFPQVFLLLPQPSFPPVPAHTLSLPLLAPGPEPTKRDFPRMVSRVCCLVLEKKGFSILKTALADCVQGAVLR